MKSIFHQPVPELPVKDVEKAQAFYRDNLEFTVAWTDPSKLIGAVSKDEAAIFLRQHDQITPVTVWIFVDDVDETYEEIKNTRVTIADPLETKPWNIRQFTIEDLDGNRFIFHHDVSALWLH